MKRTLALSVLLLVLGGCSSEYNKCVESEAKKLEVTPEVAEIRAENIAIKSQSTFKIKKRPFRQCVKKKFV